jgi:aspartyl-tRNA(Asn)/glutamyl-tRNA(Gln) amidotransferase subunit A
VSALGLRLATAAALGRLLRRREISAVELAREALDGLDREGRALNCVAELTPERAMREARGADRMLRRGEGGPLVGIPYGAKDLLDTAGIPTRWGTPHYRDRVADADATAITKMRAAGAVLVAKLAMVELAGGGGYRYANASIDGPGLNPWDPTRWSGGSSSGSASAVAAGLIPLSLGSETGGSLVIPAAYCGITTIRPTAGLVSRAGAMPLSWSMDKIGPLTRTAVDSAAALRALAGPDPLDWTTEAVTLRARAGHVGAANVRVGVLGDGLDGAPETAAVFDAALRVMRRLGFGLRRVQLPKRDYLGTYLTILSGEAAATHGDFIRAAPDDALVDRTQLEGLRRMLDVPLADHARAVETRGRLAREIHGFFDDVDVLLSPTVLTEATPLDEDVLAGRAKRGGYAMLGAIAGIPGVSVPMGFGPSGLPLGLSFSGPRFSDLTLLGIAARYQRETDWHTLRPPSRLTAGTR